MQLENYYKSINEITLSKEEKQALFQKINSRYSVTEQKRKKLTRRMAVPVTVFSLLYLFVCFSYFIKPLLVRNLGHADYAEHTPAAFGYQNAKYFKATAPLWLKLYNLPEKITSDLLGECITTVTKKDMQILDEWQAEQFKKFEGRNVYRLKNAADDSVLILDSEDGYCYYIFSTFITKFDEWHPENYPDSDFAAHPELFYQPPVWMEDKNEEIPLKRFFEFYSIRTPEDIACLEVTPLVCNDETGSPKDIGGNTGRIQDTAFCRQLFLTLAPICPIIAASREDVDWNHQFYTELDDNDFTSEGKTLADMEKYNDKMHEKALEITKEISKGTCLLTFTAKNGSKMRLIYYPKQAKLAHGTRYFLLSEETNQFLSEKAEKALKQRN